MEDRTDFNAKDVKELRRDLGDVTLPADPNDLTDNQVAMMNAIEKVDILKRMVTVAMARTGHLALAPDEMMLLFEYRRWRVSPKSAGGVFHFRKPVIPPRIPKELKPAKVPMPDPEDSRKAELIAGLQHLEEVETKVDEFNNQPTPEAPNLSKLREAAGLMQDLGANL